MSTLENRKSFIVNADINRFVENACFLNFKAIFEHICDEALGEIREMMKDATSQSI